MVVFHHSLGHEGMKNTFLQMPSVQGFQLALHGDIHRANDDQYVYDEKRRIHVVGAGTFAAPPSQQTAGIPLQYNLIRLDQARGLMTIHSRRKEDPDGAWEADARWGDRESPRAWRNLNLRLGPSSGAVKDI